MNETDRVRALLAMRPWAYAGVGSRETPEDVLDVMEDIGDKLQARGWCLFSGACKGADQAFERGAFSGPFRARAFRDRYALFLPWPNYEQRNGAVYEGLASPRPRAFAIAAEHHPGWDHISDGGRKMHARNVHIVLGRDCNTPVSFLVCWTPDGAIDKTTRRTGGTGQAIRVANTYQVPVFNLKRDDHMRAWKEALR